MPTIFDPIEFGPITLKNRFVLAPMTRERCTADGVPHDMHATYFAQRAVAGLIVSGNLRISPNAAGSAHGGGMHNDAQVAGWRRVVDAVHANGSRIFAQLAHAGAGGHPEILSDSGCPVAPSAVAWGGNVRTARGSIQCVVPRALETHEIKDLINQYAHSAGLALAAGFDGVELHAASGYLGDEFLCSRTNHRIDQYGGSAVNRCRFLVEVVEAIAAVVGNDRTGIKVSPEFNKYGTVIDDNPQETFSELARALSSTGMLYLNVADNSAVFDYHALLRPLFKGLYIANVNFLPERAQTYIREGRADMIAFGRLFISNPDLPERIRIGAKLNPLDPATIYAGGTRGMLDYPSLVTASGA